MKQQQLNNLLEKVKQCANCILHKNRINSVFQRGSYDSDIVFIGEAGGKNENIQGIPFCGRSGKLLDNMIRAMNFNVEDVYVTNICRCSPPNNRKPLPNEMEACKPFLVEQLNIVNPKIIVTLGSTAMEGILGSGLGIMKRHGQWGKYNNIPVMPTLHPAACLRNPKLKHIVWDDLQKVMKYLKEIYETNGNA